MTRKIFAASVQHETHSFCITPTTLDDFRKTLYLRDAEVETAMRGTRGEWGAVFDLADEFGWTVVHPVASFAQPAGPVTTRAFEHFSEVILDSLKKNLPFDGILLPMHGAMIVEDFDDAEGELLARIRKVVGAKVPIAMSLDVHANASEAMARHADIITTYRTTPHIDMYETCERAGRLLERAMKGEIRPKVHRAQGPVMFGIDEGRTVTHWGPMRDMMKKVAAAEAADPGVLDIGVNAGFGWGDTEFTGPTVLVNGDGAHPRYQALADELIKLAWDQRGVYTIDFLTIAEGIRIASEPRSGSGPLLIGDYTDNPGGGAHGDGTAFLKALLESTVEDAVVGHIADPESAEIGIRAGIGATVTLPALGGKTDPRFGGTPLEVTGKVAAIADGVYTRKGKYATGTQGTIGPSFLLDLGRVKVIVSSIKSQIDDREQFRMFGIVPETTNVLLCKASNHFRADFEPIARRLIYIDSGGIVSRNFAQFPYKKVRRPVWPLDPI
jgi:microcystin degradation protein MlrC